MSGHLLRPASQILIVLLCFVVSESGPLGPCTIELSLKKLVNLIVEDLLSLHHSRDACAKLSCSGMTRRIENNDLRHTETPKQFAEGL